MRHHLKGQHLRLGEGSIQLAEFEHMLNSEALIIGFARRFATYKRATLIFRDPERLRRILNNPEHPMQIIFAGKAHPADGPGKALIEQVYRFSRSDAFRGKVIFLENYDIEMARYLVSGTDLWLNNPIRPHEASGTSGRKQRSTGSQIAVSWTAGGPRPTTAGMAGRLGRHANITTRTCRMRQTASPYMHCSKTRLSRPTMSAGTMAFRIAGLPS